MKAFRGVQHRNRRRESPPEPPVEIDQVWVYVIQKSFSWHQTHCHRESAAERLNQALRVFTLPQRKQTRHQPAFAAGPFQRRPKFWRRYHSSRSADEIGRRAARTAGSRPPTSPITSAYDNP